MRPRALRFPGLRGGRGFVAEFFQGVVGPPTDKMIGIIQKLSEAGDGARVVKFPESFHSGFPDMVITVAQK